MKTCWLKLQLQLRLKLHQLIVTMKKTKLDQMSLLEHSPPSRNQDLRHQFLGPDQGQGLNPICLINLDRNQELSPKFNQLLAPDLSQQYQLLNQGLGPNHKCQNQ